MTKQAPSPVSTQTPPAAVPAPETIPDPTQDVSSESTGDTTGDTVARSYVSVAAIAASTPSHTLESQGPATDPSDGGEWTQVKGKKKKSPCAMRLSCFSKPTSSSDESYVSQSTPTKARGEQSPPTTPTEDQNSITGDSKDSVSGLPLSPGVTGCAEDPEPDMPIPDLDDSACDGSIPPLDGNDSDASESIMGDDLLHSELPTPATQDFHKPDAS